MMKEVTSQLLTDYNNERMFATTLDLYHRRDQRRDEEGSVALHYQAVLAGLMLGRNVDRMVARLKGCLDYNSIIEGDLYRDQALALIRRREHLDEAENLIRRAMHNHSDDLERQAVDLQAEARLQEARGLPNEAYATLRQALDTHKVSPQPRNKVLLANTAFHTLRLAVKVGDRSSRYAHQALRIVTYNDQSWQKRWAARAMYYLPDALGVNLVERLA
jgi:hypothetical protein